MENCLYKLKEYPAGQRTPDTVKLYLTYMLAAHFTQSPCTLYTKPTAMKWLYSEWKIESKAVLQSYQALNKLISIRIKKPFGAVRNKLPLTCFL